MRPVRAHVASVLPGAPTEVMVSLVLDNSPVGDSLRIILPVEEARRLSDRLSAVTEARDEDGRVVQRSSTP